jgi:hypothetical protein
MLQWPQKISVRMISSKCEINKAEEETAKAEM